MPHGISTHLLQQHREQARSSFGLSQLLCLLPQEMNAWQLVHQPSVVVTYPSSTTVEQKRKRWPRGWGVKPDSAEPPPQFRSRDMPEIILMCTFNQQALQPRRLLLTAPPSRFFEAHNAMQEHRCWGIIAARTEQVIDLLMCDLSHKLSRVLS
mmetsp:Transcript_27311/g.63656  ORF Transcript_27311/g.63656 Transcript_27311/m.63656 type:complete len:153 (-) Transcript_27311:585-1043(-)